MHYKPVRRWPLEIVCCWCSREQPRLGDVPLTTDGPACCLEALRTEQSRSVLKGVRVINTQCGCVFGLVLVGTGFHPHTHTRDGWQRVPRFVLPEHRAGSCPGLQRCWCVSCKCCSWVITLHRAHLNFHVCKMWYLNLYLVWSGQLQAGVWCLCSQPVPRWSCCHSALGLIMVRIGSWLFPNRG